MTPCEYGTACEAHGLECEDWSTVDVLPIPESVENWYVVCGDQEPAQAKWMILQELRSLTCLTANSDGGFEQQLKPPYRTRTLLVAETV